MVKNVDSLLTQIRSCQICDGLPLGPKPILQIGASAKILIAGQAPGRITHHKGIPFDDPSGNRLRDWLGISRDEFSRISGHLLGGANQGEYRAIFGRGIYHEGGPDVLQNYRLTISWKDLPNYFKDNIPTDSSDSSPPS